MRLYIGKLKQYSTQLIHPKEKPLGGASSNSVSFVIVSQRNVTVSPPQVKCALLTLWQIAVISAVVVDSTERSCGQEVDDGKRKAQKQAHMNLHTGRKHNES